MPLKPLIFIVEDDPDIQKYIQMILEHNDYRVVTTDNGKNALNLLTEGKTTPDLIISDIMMPEMDGYEFIKQVSNHPDLFQVPFIFVTALDSREDIRLGKLLGADDYLTKPIDEDDLLASIAGKILKKQNASNFSSKLKDYFSAYTVDQLGSKPKIQEDEIYLVEVSWDDYLGPKLDAYYPISVNMPINDIALQLYSGINVIYGYDKVCSSEELLVKIDNFDMTGYAYFDCYPNDEFRSGEKDFMLAVIANRISFYQSLKIKHFLTEFADKIKKNEEIDKNALKEYWEEIKYRLVQN